MPLVTSKELFAKAYKGRYAIGAFNVDNVDIMKAVLKAAERTKSPVIIAISSGALGFIGKECVKNAIDDALKSITIPVVLHLDHGKSVELCKECVDIGFTSVMIDASGYDFDKNIAITKEVVEYAHARGVVVESELGAIAGIEEDIHVEDKYGHFTHPEDVIEFVSKTGIDSLAIAIGTAHGAFKFRPGQKPQLRFDILEEIEAKLPGFPLVLHGASSVPKASLDTLNKYGGKMPEAVGIPEDMLRDAARRAVCKINVGTDIRVAYVGGMRKALFEKPEEFDTRLFINAGLNAITDLVADKMVNVLGSAGRAND
ncbi:MAG: ketose-bisphosphate aldolase [Bacilli bacterium]|jgi:fructose-bisphosphate aldolase class II|nr:ketose-bisphosphate aldolase [Bacilli bacterium]